MHHDYELDTTRRDATMQIRTRGRAVLANPMTNRGTAFTTAERQELEISGLLPTGVNSMSTQARRTYEQYQSARTPFAKHNYLANLRDRNEILFYRVFADHLEEMMPIIYTPTIGEVIERFSVEYNRPRGVFLSIDRPEQIEQSLREYGLDADDVDLLVATDSEGILGIGDQGIGGIQIAIGKISVYTAAAGIHPRRAIPIVLDTGTDNLGLLNSSFYLGARHPRVRGERYDAFIKAFVEACAAVFPHAMIHWEDFGATNAHRILEAYRDDYCTFNDDIQGTAAVVLAALLAGINASGQQLPEHRVVSFGAGSAGIGIAQLLMDHMVAAGIPREQAQAKFYPIGLQGLYVDDMDDLLDFQRPFARPRSEVAQWGFRPGENISLLDVVREVKPTILIGTSTAGGAFTEEVVKEMHKHCERPIIFPLSNPTARAEANPADLIEWTDGHALIATGSPFDDVDHNEIRHHIAQANNALIFPGIGLGVAACQASRVTDSMISAAAQALAARANTYLPGSSLLPSINELRPVSAQVAIAVAQAAEREGVARRPLTEPLTDIFQRMWMPEYPPIEVI
ncbi:NAD-dependent malic enzyme [Arsenicicoccus piscis]|uniref:NAD-dependent malic enzyme n=1 Tax=Arsenicicoccus piscis TaxID=673954 RepID=A0ABQ6HTC2_9MICO|nr:NAD-dependent malic enzyme [Arsenicicoccus piscis]MCH8626327.1 NAD-dependent malic enzyme [Arsenicicoccus piscis]GMA20933.1 NAD-dependent malic enzyme [Arsenicicoccus piscis]